MKSVGLNKRKVVSKSLNPLRKYKEGVVKEYSKTLDDKDDEKKNQAVWEDKKKERRVKREKKKEVIQYP